MTKEMLEMTKDELIDNIAKADEYGKRLEVSTKALIDSREELLRQVNELEEHISRGVAAMESLAVARAEMDKILKDKYGVFVM